jgi:CRP/FNR family cyclic AMP-dependent transcriptional regulator
VNGPAEIAAVVATVTLFARLKPRQRERLARLATRRHYQAGDVIVRQGATSMSLYVVLTGAVRVQREAEDGPVVVLAEHGRGFCFGEMGLLDDAPRVATVVAREPTDCALLARWDFETELHRDPAIALALLPILTRRIRELEIRLAREQPFVPPAGADSFDPDPTI